MRFSAASRDVREGSRSLSGSLSSFGSLVRAGWRGGLRSFSVPQHQADADYADLGSASAPEGS